MKKYVKRGITAICAMALVFGLTGCAKTEVVDDILNETGSSSQEADGNNSNGGADEKPAAKTEEKVSSAEEFTYTEENGEIVITGYTGEATVIEIPESIEGKPVTVIGEKAFAGKEEITEVIMPDSILTVRKSAFERCYGLTKVTLSQSLQVLEYGSFFLSAVEQIEFPETLTTIGAMALNNTNINEIVIPPLVTEIGSGAFCSANIETLTIPGTVKVIRDQAFKGCDNLKTVVIEEGVEVIEEDAFGNCSSLESISFPASATELGTSIFYGSGPSGKAMPVYVPKGSVAESVFTEEYKNNEYYDIISQ